MAFLNTISIVTPCFNEGKSVVRFLNSLEKVLKEEVDFNFQVIVVDDRSNDDTLTKLCNYKFTAPNISLHIIQNLFNVGHQQSIFQGLIYSNNLTQEFLIIMDSDGEDNPMAIPLLLKNRDYDIVEVKRKKRSESFLFRFFYFVYKLFFRIITGKIMNYGNYCMLSNTVVEKIRFTSFIHLPAYLLKHGGKRSFIKYDRSSRIEGKSKMGYKELFLHAFKSFVEFGDDLLLWFLRLFGIVAIGLVLVLINLFYQKFISHTAIPGWFSTLFIGLLNLAMLSIGFFVLGILLINLMHHRNNSVGANYKVLKGKARE